MSSGSPRFAPAIGRTSPRKKLIFNIFPEKSRSSQNALDLPVVTSGQRMPVRCGCVPKRLPDRRLSLIQPRAWAPFCSAACISPTVES